MRPNHDQYFLNIAEAVSLRSTCLRRAVGCVLVDERHHIVATGYNGVAAGQAHCRDEAIINLKSMGGEQLDGVTYPHACGGAYSPQGTDLDRCQAIHAEQNALVQCRDAYAIHTVYCTCEPCVSCTKLLLGTSAERVVYIAPYFTNSGAELWGKSRDPNCWGLGSPAKSPF